MTGAARAPRIFIAGLITETNTFSPLPTGMGNYEETALFHGDATAHPDRWASAALLRWRQMGEARGAAIVESLFAMAQPAGPTTRAAHAALTGEILDDLKRAGPLDMVLLALHGAMVAEDCDDCEGALLERVRALVGADATVGVLLDLHCHLTEAMTALADVIVVYKEYPHTDVAERGDELFRLCERAWRGEIAPVMSAHDCRMIGLWRTRVDPMPDFVARMQAAEGVDDVLSVSFAHGFPWGDVEAMGARMLVVTDDAPERGAALARRFARELWDMREATRMPAVPLDDALQDALRGGASGPVVVADIADNPGGGAPGDSTFVLRRMIDSGVENAALAAICDAEAVRVCFEAGEGAAFTLRVGGKLGAASGSPLDLDVVVRALRRDMVQTMRGVQVRMGDAAWIAHRGIDIVLCSIRTQVMGLDAFSGLGIDPLGQRLLVVKSMHHFTAAFAPIASRVIYAAAPGALSVDFAAIPYRKLTRPVWPRIANPFEDVSSP